MAFFILVAFIAVPIIEIAVLIEVGGAIGLLPTLALIILTAVIGTALLRAQGLATLERARTALDRGEMPVEQVFHGVLLLAAGLLLLTPGFVTDGIGFVLFVPSVRALFGRAVFRHLMQHGSVHVYGTQGPPPPRGGRPGQRDRGPVETVIIEGDYVEVREEDENGRDSREPGSQR